MRKTGPVSPLKQTFRLAGAEGFFSQVFMTLAGTGSVFITKYAMALGAKPVHFGLTGLARWSALIPLLWIQEPAAKSLGKVLLYYRQFAKVRIFQLLTWATQKKD